MLSKKVRNTLKKSGVKTLCTIMAAATLMASAVPAFAEEKTPAVEAAAEVPVVESAEAGPASEAAEEAPTVEATEEAPAIEAAEDESIQTENSSEKKPMAEKMENVVASYDKDGKLVLTNVDELGGVVYTERGLKFRQETNEETGETYLVADIVQIIDPSLPVNAYELQGSSSWNNGDVRFVIRVTPVNKQTSEDKGEETGENPADDKAADTTVNETYDDPADWEVIDTIPEAPAPSPVFISIEAAKEWADLNIREEYDINEYYGKNLWGFEVNRQGFSKKEDALAYLDKRKKEMRGDSASQPVKCDNGLLTYECGTIYDYVTETKGDWMELPLKENMESFTLDKMDTHEKEELARLDQMVAGNIGVDVSDVRAISARDEETGRSTRIYFYTKGDNTYSLTFAHKVNYENGKSINQYAPVEWKIKRSAEGPAEYVVYEYCVQKLYKVEKSAHADAIPEMYDYYRSNGHTYTAKDGSTVFLYRDPNGKGIIDDDHNFYEFSVSKTNPGMGKMVSADGHVYYGEVY